MISIPAALDPRRVLLLLALLPACSRSEPEPASAAAEELAVPTFPVRLFPPTPPAPDVFVDDAFSEPDAGRDWLAIDLGEGGVTTSLLDSPSLAPANGRVTVPPGMQALARIFVVPPKTKVECTARLDVAKESPAGSCNLLWFLPLAPAGTAHDSSVAHRGLEAARAYVGRNKDMVARWDPCLDGGGAKVARGLIEPADEPRRIAVFVPPCESESFSLLGLSARRVVEFNEVTNSDRLASASDSGDLAARIHPVRVWGLQRRCILLQPSEEIVLESHVFRGAETIEVSSCLEPVAIPGLRSKLVMSVETRHGVFEPIGTCDMSHFDAGEPFFERYEFAWPRLDASLTAARVKFTVEGNSSMLLAEPMLRAPPPARGRPNLLLISIDTLRRDHLGCYGYERNTSPFLDELAARGVRFANFVAVSSYTLPTHATMLTGLLPPRHGAVASTERLATERLPYLPAILRSFNYHTAAFTAGGFVSDAFGFGAGFDRFGAIDPLTPDDDDLDSKHKVGREVRRHNNLDRACDWIDTRGDEPWFAFVHTFVVHEYDAPDSDLEEFDSRPELTQGRDYLDWLRNQGWVKEPPTEGDRAHLVDRYDATIHYCDRMLRRFFERLDSIGALDDTVVAIVSDHGEEFLEHGSLRHSVTLYEEMLEVPWILVDPKGPRGLVVREPVSQADVMPTLLDLLRIELPGDLDGHSCAPLLRGERERFVPTPLYAQVATSLSRRVALRHGAQKLIQNALDREQMHPAAVPLELFDLRDDPRETRNLATDRLADFDRLHRGLASLQDYLSARALGHTPATIDAAVDEQLRQLGYVR